MRTVGLLLFLTAVLWPQQPTAEIRGTVIDALKSIPLHTVGIELRGEGIRRVVEAGTQGYKISALPAGVYEMTVSAGFYFPMTIRSVRVKSGEVRVLPPLELVFRGIEGCHDRSPTYLRVLDEPSAGRGAVGGIVVDERGGGLADARVRLYVDDTGTVASAITDVEGRFSIGDAPAGKRYKIEIGHDGYYTEDFTDFTVQAGYESVYDRLGVQVCASGRCPALTITSCF